MAKTDTHRGARIGMRIADIVSKAMVITHNKLMGTRRKLATLIFNDITNEISDEAHTALGRIFMDMADAYEQGGPAAGLVQFMAHGRGQFKAIVGSSSAAQSLLWALGSVISNELAPFAYGYISANPHLTPDPATLAGFAATGRMAYGDAVHAIAQNGYTNHWADSWIDSQRAYPSVQEAAGFLRKGFINDDKFVELAGKNGTTSDVAGLYFLDTHVPVSMQDLAVGYLRGEITEGALYAQADAQGYDQGDVRAYLSSIGEPPGATDLMEALRRGQIDEATFERGILQSRMRNEWIPVLRNLRYSPMSTADAVNAAVQNHITLDEAERIADENGLQPGQFGFLYETAGAPLSRTELNDLYNRGLIGSDVVIQGLRESRLKDKYGPDAFALRRRLLEPRTIASAVHEGVIDHDTGIRMAMEHGFNAEDAATLVNTSVNMKVRLYKDRVVAEVEALYEDGAMTREQAMNVAGNMGFTPTEAQYITLVGDYKREDKVFKAATSAIRSKFIGHHITAGEASGLLDNIGAPATQRDFLLGMWEIERAANVRSLTEAQIVKAVKKQLITPEDGLSRLTDMGYTDADAALLLEEI